MGLFIHVKVLWNLFTILKERINHRIGENSLNISINSVNIVPFGYAYNESRLLKFSCDNYFETNFSWLFIKIIQN